MNRIPKYEVNEYGFLQKKNIWYHDDIYDHLMSRATTENHPEFITSKKILSIVDKMIHTLSTKKFYSKNQKKLRKALTIQMFSAIINFNRGYRAYNKAIYQYQEENNKSKLTEDELSFLKKTVMDDYIKNLGHLRVYQNKTAFFKNPNVTKFSDHLTYDIQRECINIMVSSGLFTLKTGHYDMECPKNSKISEIHIHKDAQKNVLSTIPEQFRNSLQDDELWILQVLFTPKNSFKDFLYTYPWGQDEVPELQAEAIKRIYEARRNKTILSRKKDGETFRKEMAVDNEDLSSLDERLYGDLGEIYKHKQVFNVGKSENHFLHGRYYSELQNVSSEFRNAFCKMTGKKQLDFTASLPNYINLIETGQLLDERPYAIPYKEAYRKKLNAKNRRLKKENKPEIVIDEDELNKALEYVGNCLKKVYLSANNTSEESLRNIFYTESRKHNLIPDIDTLAKHLDIDNPKEYLTKLESENPAEYSKLQATVRNDLIEKDLLEKYGYLPFDPSTTLRNFTFTFRNFYDEYQKLNKDSLHYLDSGISNQYMFDESKFMINTVRDLPKSIPLMMVHDEIVVPEEHSNVTDRLMNKNRISYVLNVYKSVTKKVDEYLCKSGKNITGDDLLNLFEILPSEFEQSILYKYLTFLNIEFDSDRIVRKFLRKYKNSNSNFTEILNNLKNLLAKFTHYYETHKIKRLIIFKFHKFNKYINNLIVKPIIRHKVIGNTNLEMVGEGKPPP